MVKEWLARILAIKFMIEVGKSVIPHLYQKHLKSLFYFAFLIFIILAMVYILTGCQIPQQRLDPNIIYRRDIQFEINGQEFDGVAVPKRAKEYDIKLKAKGQIDVLTIRSCHREDVFNKPKGGFFGGQSKKFEYKYIPVEGIETGNGCLLDIGAFEEKKGRHGWGVVDFEAGVENLPATLKCDGKEYNTNPKSVSICQAREGSLQEIIFDHKVKVSPDKGCEVMETKDEMTYIYQIAKGECTYYFGDKYGNFHRLTTIGYSGILIRGDE